jgi:hypothetical protein
MQQERVPVSELRRIIDEKPISEIYFQNINESLEKSGLYFFINIYPNLLFLIFKF